MIKVLTYNLNHQSMRSIKPQCPNSLCLTNASEFIRSNKSNFICLQEVANLDQIIQYAELNSMLKIETTSELNRIVTFYDHTYEMDFFIEGEFGPGRPFHLIFFNPDLCLINLHAGHDATNDIKTFDQKVQSLILTLGNHQIILHRLSFNDIIMCGDFNNDLSHEAFYQIFLSDYFLQTRTLRNITKEITCCDPNLKNNPQVMSYINDHILTTFNESQTIVHSIQLASDHKPLTSIIYKKKVVAYDFDGVMHKTVGPPNELGQRIHIPGPLAPFTSIIKSIQSTYSNIIITARYPDLEVESFIKDNSIPIKKIIFTSGQSKVPYLASNKVNIFYDDSCSMIIDIYENILSNNLPHLSRLYFVQPETSLITLINRKNYYSICKQYLPIGAQINILNRIIDTCEHILSNPEAIKRFNLNIKKDLSLENLDRISIYSKRKFCPQIARFIVEFDQALS